MLVSIITAVRNRNDTIDCALDSLYSQSFRDFEHIIQDGASSDGTLDQIMARSDPRTKLVSVSDGGIYNALNRGLERAKGDIVGVLHSDDFFANGQVLARVVETFKATGADAVYGDLHYVSNSDASRVIRTWRAGPFHSEKLAAGWMPPHPALFLNKRIVKRLGRYDEKLTIAADYEAILRLFRQPGFRAVYVPEVFVKMRVGGESNRSLDRIIKKSIQDYWAIRRHGVGGLKTLAGKNLSKVRQFLG